MTVEDALISTGRGSAEAERLTETAIADHFVRLEEDPRWGVARRVAASKGFAKSKYLISFILYICEKHLLGQTGEITEQLIGEHVFRRPQGYNPGEDNIVRNYARLLRQRLDEYFSSEGIDETIRIAVPRGGYVPIFIEEDKAVGERRPQPAQVGLIGVVGSDSSQQQPEETVERAVKDPVRPGRQVWGLRALCAALFIALVFVMARDIHIKSPQQNVSDRFWSVFFSSTRDTLLVPADSGLVIYQDLTNRRIPLAEYAAGEYQKHTSATSGIDSAMVNELGGRRYTSVVDLHVVSAISQLPAVVKNRFKVRYAREVTLDDLKQSNVILLGSFDSNPWVDLFQRDLNFQFEHQPKVDDVVIHNLHPLAGESEYYKTNQSDSARSTFGLIVVTPNLDGTGHVLLIEGINMAGTEAAADYLFSDASAPLLSKIFDSKGNILPFEVLLETGNIGANAPRPRIISQRILQR
ncbi:hypothetical protein [Tunturiibacter gelidiferens]|uniref:hypothetical protein n=1 Tax=Tunturiibacter gelidiferens TaxID=3069689 RepID=UPI003D9ABD23